MDAHTWLWVGFVGMAIGAAVILFQMGRRTPEEEVHGVIHAIVPMIAAGLYLLISLNEGALALSNREFLWGRYLDWSFTTPLLLIGLALTAMGDLRRRLSIVVAMVGADIYMIFAGFQAGLAPTGTDQKWIWFLMSSGAFAGVIWVIWYPLRAEAKRAGNSSDYDRNAAILSVLWLLYPVVFAFGDDGAMIISPVLASFGYTVLDLVSKVAYGILSTAETKAKFDREVSGARPLPQT